LYEEWLLSNFAKLEWVQLKWFKEHQQRIRSDLYSGVIDNVAAGEIDAARTGRVVVLPSSFVGSPRYMVEKYHDSMAVIRSKGPPSLFITMTCNTAWKEIKEALRDGEQAIARPEIVCRVFRLKVKQLYHDIKVKEIYGPVEGISYSIEFQKRGLPHMHMLVTLEGTHRPITPADVDSLTQATLVDEEDDPILHELVTKHMIHNPCGQTNPRAPCMKDGECQKHYPKNFHTRTSFRDDGTPIYARPNDGRGFWCASYGSQHIGFLTIICLFIGKLSMVQDTGLTTNRLSHTIGTS